MKTLRDYIVDPNELHLWKLIRKTSSAPKWVLIWEFRSPVHFQTILYAILGLVCKLWRALQPLYSCSLPVSATVIIILTSMSPCLDVWNQKETWIICFSWFSIDHFSGWLSSDSTQHSIQSGLPAPLQRWAAGQGSSNFLFCAELMKVPSPGLLWIRLPNPDFAVLNSYVLISVSEVCACKRN